MTTFGHYELQGLLGRGGMGEVHRAYDHEHGRVVALKLLPAALATDEDYVERFRRESHAAARLRDPHVIPIHRYGKIGERLYIDMRLVDGRDLAELLKREGPLPPARAVALVGQAAEALDAAHADGLLHRDVKPSNLLVTRQDFVYLLDFGIAQETGGSAAQRPLTAEGMAVGTFDYMAPERILGRRDVDARADVYSLACVLHECLTGTRPFPVHGLPALIHAHLETPAPRVTERSPGAPEALDEVIARGMAKEPRDRYASCGELAAAARGVTAPGPAGVAASAAEAPTLLRPPRSATPRAPRPAVAPGPGPSRGVRAAVITAVTTGVVAAAVLVAVAVGQGWLGSTTPGGSTGASGALAADTSTATSAAVVPPTTGGATSAAPQTRSQSAASVSARARGDLGLDRAISSPACDGRWVLFVGSAVHPQTYARDVAALLAAHPGSSYLLTDGGCTSLRQRLADGTLIYAVYLGPFPSQAAACAAHDRVGGSSYAKVLDDTTPPDRLWTC